MHVVRVGGGGLVDDGGGAGDEGAIDDEGAAGDDEGGDVEEGEDGAVDEGEEEGRIDADEDVVVCKPDSIDDGVGEAVDELGAPGGEGDEEDTMLGAVKLSVPVVDGKSKIEQAGPAHEIP